MTQFKYTVWHYVSDFHNFVISISTCPRTGIQLFVTSGAACLKWTILLEYIVEAFFNAVTFFQQRFQLKLKPTKLLIESRQYPHLNIYCMWITVVTEHKHKKNTCLIEPFPDDNFKKYDTKHIPIWPVRHEVCPAAYIVQFWLISQLLIAQAAYHELHVNNLNLFLRYACFRMVCSSVGIVAIIRKLRIDRDATKWKIRELRIDVSSQGY
jgi:hypothetical protein